MAKRMLSKWVGDEFRPWVGENISPDDTMRWLLPEQRERIQSPDFFQLLQTHVTRKYLALSPVAAATALGPQPQPAGGAKPPAAAAPDCRGPARRPSGP